MTPSKQKKRLILAAFIILCASIATLLAIYGLGQNINLYYTPEQLISHEAPLNHTIRVGGIVKSGSIHHERAGLTVRFVVTDSIHNIPVKYTGVLPDLFRAGQGIIIQGKYNSKDIFIADQVLAKHGADYMPPMTLEGIKQAKK